MSQVRVYGVDIKDGYARQLIARLNRVGTPPAVAAANRIADGLARQGTAGPLTPEMRDAILAALRRPDHAGTKVLYRALRQDQGARRDT